MYCNWKRMVWSKQHTLNAISNRDWRELEIDLTGGSILLTLACAYFKIRTLSSGMIALIFHFVLNCVYSVVYINDIHKSPIQSQSQ